MEEITKTDSMRKSINYGMMVRWINQDLVNRADCDVRKSFVYYDEDKMFEFATVNELSDKGKDALAAASNIRYWSKGIV